jgi:LIVCS family branched-chain amino acid:cation transporter
VIDGFKTLCDLLEIPYFDWLTHILFFYQKYLPLYQEGMGWLAPATAALLISGIWVRITQAETE